ncbi:hypothetical protein Acr_07g0007700 [Actinidia rufa]|uniref:Uncharacterized protein n=1 Tax=Actinidia rufa TaxID=165716 RepID=A0A7J0EVZ7_9ERIC|nr:hypothetical protein Acr_01g0015540 [Actinidia rufa]GFY81751.1 hypothetical protein Acr_01g0015590 [Actinidia rufa]GFY90570.1 hypothetical protein Acr_07g0007670 [Actinidia rufa]GFY90573.1 hypothetical protein Acr_07g0007700 [Actinidia rufa]
MRKIHSSDETSNKKLPAFHRFEARPSGTDLENGPIDQSLSFWPSITSIRPFASRASTQNEPNRAKELSMFLLIPIKKMQRWMTARLLGQKPFLPHRRASRINWEPLTGSDLDQGSS